jgi:hypothetical protein
MLALKGVGETVVTRLEQIGFSSLPIFASDIAAARAGRFLSGKRPDTIAPGTSWGLTQRDTATQAGIVGTHDLDDGLPKQCNGGRSPRRWTRTVRTGR